jgi:hypothetical protein
VEKQKRVRNNIVEVLKVFSPTDQSVEDRF